MNMVRQHVRKVGYISRQQLKLHIMRSLFILLTALLMMTATSCSDSNGTGNTTNETDEQRLTSHTWVSYKVTNGTDDVTSTTSISMNFNSDGSFTATGFTGASSGTWSLGNGILFLGDAGSWTVLLLNDSELRIRDGSGIIEIHFN